MATLNIRRMKNGLYRPYYIYSVTINGKQVKKQISGPVAKDRATVAKEFKTWLKEFDKKAYEKRLMTERRPCPTLREFAPRYMEYAIGRTLTGEGVDRAKSSLKHLNQHLGGLLLREITPRVLDQYVTTRKAETFPRTGRPFAPKTINIELTQLSSVMEAAIRLEVIDEHPFKTPRRPLTSYFLKTEKKVPVVLQFEEIRRMLAATQGNAHNVAVFLFLLLSGMRKGELAGLRWEHVDLEHKTITFPSPKTDDFRSIPLSDTLVALLQHMRTHWPEPLGGKTWIPRTLAQMTYVFCRKDGRPYHREMGGFLRNLAHKAGITKKVTPHVLRHSLAAYGRSHFTVFQLQRLLGHKNVTTTEKYGMLLDTGMQEGINKVAEMMGLDHALVSSKNVTPIAEHIDKRRNLEEMTGTHGKRLLLQDKIGSPTGNRTPV